MINETLKRSCATGLAELIRRVIVPVLPFPPGECVSELALVEMRTEGREAPPAEGRARDSIDGAPDAVGIRHLVAGGRYVELGDSDTCLVDPWLRELGALLPELAAGCRNGPVEPILVLRDALLGLSSIFLLVGPANEGGVTPYQQLFTIFRHLLALWSHHSANLHELVAREGAHVVLLVERRRSGAELRELQLKLQQIFSRLGLGSSLLWHVDAHFAEIPGVCDPDTWDDLAELMGKDTQDPPSARLEEWRPFQRSAGGAATKHWLVQLLGQHLPNYRRWISQGRAPRTGYSALSGKVVKSIRRYASALAGACDPPGVVSETATKKILDSASVVDAELARGKRGNPLKDQDLSFPSVIGLLDFAEVVIPGLMDRFRRPRRRKRRSATRPVLAVHFLESRLRRHQLQGVRLALAPVTLVTGLNRGGKSTISQALSLALHNCILAPAGQPYVLEMEPIPLTDSQGLMQRLTDASLPGQHAAVTCRYSQDESAPPLSERLISSGLVLRWLITPGLLRDAGGRLVVFANLVLHLLFPEEQGVLEECMRDVRRAFERAARQWTGLNQELRKTLKKCSESYLPEWETEPMVAMIRRPILDVLAHLLLGLMLVFKEKTELKEEVGTLFREICGENIGRVRKWAQQTEARDVLDELELVPEGVGASRPDSILLRSVADVLKRITNPPRLRSQLLSRGAAGTLFEAASASLDQLRPWAKWTAYLTQPESLGRRPDEPKALPSHNALRFSLWEDLGDTPELGPSSAPRDRASAGWELASVVSQLIQDLLPAFWLRDATRGVDPGRPAGKQFQSIEASYRERQNELVKELLRTSIAREGQSAGGPARDDVLGWLLNGVFPEVHHLLLQYTWNWNRHRITFDEQGEIWLEPAAPDEVSLPGRDVLNTGDLVTAFYALSLSIFLLDPTASGRVLVLDDLLNALDPVQARSLIAGIERIRHAEEMLEVMNTGSRSLRTTRRRIELKPDGTGEFAQECRVDSEYASMPPQTIFLDSREEVLWETAEWAGAPVTAEIVEILHGLLWPAFYKDFSAGLQRAIEARSGDGRCGGELPTWLEVKPWMSFAGHGATAEGECPHSSRPVDEMMQEAWRLLCWLTGWTAGAEENEALKDSEVAVAFAKHLADWLTRWDLLPFALDDVAQVLHPSGVALYRIPQPWTAAPGGDAVLQGGLRVRRIPAWAFTELLCTSFAKPKC